MNAKVFGKFYDFQYLWFCIKINFIQQLGLDVSHSVIIRGATNAEADEGSFEDTWFYSENGSRL